MKTVCLLRWGAWGDNIMCTPIYRLLKEEGYHVTAYVEGKGEAIIRHNPYIDKIRIHEKGSTPMNELQDYWKKVSKEYDRFINLSGSIEQGLLAVEGTPEFNLTKAERHEKYNHNYYDRTLEIAGFKEKGIQCELHFTNFEEKLIQKQRKKYKDKFIILWSLSGSSFHKAYPWADLIGDQLGAYKDILILTVGDGACQILEWQGENVKNYSGTFGIRKTLLWTKYADLVVGTETGVMVGAACYDTPKIIMLSHASEENLTKYWTNTVALNAPVMCYPCHQLHYTLDSCPLDKVSEGPVCMSYISPEKVRSAILKTYEEWLDRRNLKCQHPQPQRLSH